MRSEEIALAALWVASTSSLIAAASLGWQVYNALRVDRARLKVRTTHSILVPGGQMVCVAVTNHGRRPTQVTNLMLGVGRRPQRFLPRRWRRGTHLMPAPVVGLSATIPASIGVGESLSVFYVASNVAHAAHENGAGTVFGLANGTTTGTRYSKYINAPR